MMEEVSVWNNNNFQVWHTCVWLVLQEWPVQHCQLVILCRVMKYVSQSIRQLFTGSLNAYGEFYVMRIPRGAGMLKDN